jgi:hypothetical protein
MSSRGLTGAPLHVSNAHASLPHLLLLSPPLPLIHDLSTTATHQTLTTGDGILDSFVVAIAAARIPDHGIYIFYDFRSYFGGFFVLRNRLAYVLWKFVEGFWC